MKRPSLQFYPADWRNDPALRMCSLAARGLWWEMICVMHTCEPYGHLTAAGKAIEPEELARIVGESAKDVRRLLAELERNQIFSRDSAGIIFSRRMVRDENQREGWRDRQNKSRAKERDVTPNVTAGVTALSQPSSSSSSSSSSSAVLSSLRSDTPQAADLVSGKTAPASEELFEIPAFMDRRGKRASKPKAAALVLPDWLPAEQWAAFVEMRRKIRQPMTDHAMKLAIRALDKLRAQGHDPGSVLDASTLKNYRGLFPLRPDEAPTSAAAAGNGIDADRLARVQALEEAARLKPESAEGPPHVH